jgi:hypothetical protein
MYLYIVVHIGHVQRSRLKDCLSALVLYDDLGKHNEMKQIFHILRFLHFNGNRKEPDKTNENYERCKMRNVYDKVNAKGTQMVLSQKLEAVPF